MPGTEVVTIPPSEAPAPPHPDEHREEKKPGEVADEPLRIVLAGLDSNVDAFAREAAHERLSENPRGSLWKRWTRSAWRNLTHEYQVVRETQKARAQIQESGNLLHHHGKSDKAWREATVNRYSSDFADEMLREGETLHRLRAGEAEGNPQAGQIRDDVLKLVHGYAKGEVLDEESLEMMYGRTVDGWRASGIGKEFIGEGNFLAHNVVSMARQVKAALDSERGLSELDREARLEEMLARTEVITGEAKVGPAAEIDESLSERLAGKLRSVPFINESRLAKIVSAVGNEATIAATLSAGTYAARRSLTTAALLVPGLGTVTMLAPGLGGGIIAGLRERRKLRDERALEARRLDMGMEAPAALPDGGRQSALRKLGRLAGVRSEAERRADIGETLYAARPVEEMLDELGGLYDDTGRLNVADRAGLERAMDIFGEARARMNITSQGKRVISFGNVEPENLEDRRFDMELALAKLEVDMKHLMADTSRAAGLDLKRDETFETWASIDEAIVTGMLQGEMTAKDRLFHKLQTKRSFQQAQRGTIFGTVFGVAAHGMGVMFSPLEAEAATLSAHNTSFAHGITPGPSTHIGGFVPSEHIGNAGPSTHIGSGPAEHIGQPSGPSTHIGEAGPSVHIGERINGNTRMLSETSKLSLPQGFDARIDGNHLAITNANGQEVLHGLNLNRDGTLSAQALQSLRGAGFHVADRVDIVQGAPDVIHAHVSATEFARHHLGDMKRINHKLWFDNNTAKYDLNELGLRNGADARGNIVVNIQSMTAGGSFHGTSGVNWHEAARQGHLRVYLSASQGTQAHAFDIPVRPDGTAVIDKGSPAAALFDAHGDFSGGYEEVALNLGQTKDGAENIASLATVVGSGHHNFTDTITSPNLQSSHSYTITAPAGTGTASPNFIPSAPVTPRTNLGRARAKAFPAANAAGLASAAAITLPAMGMAAKLGSSKSAGVGFGPGRVPRLSEGLSPAGDADSSGRTKRTVGIEGMAASVGETLLIGLDDEREPYPYNSRLRSSFSPRAMKLATRAALRARKEVARKLDEGDDMFNNRIIRKAISFVHEDIASPANKPLFAETMRVLTESMKRPKQEPIKIHAP